MIPHAPTDCFEGTLELTEKSSQALMQILFEKDEEWINDLLDGKRGLMLTCSDGRSVYLSPPKYGRWLLIRTQYTPGLCPEHTLECTACGEFRKIKMGEAAPAFCEKCGADMRPKMPATSGA